MFGSFFLKLLISMLTPDYAHMYFHNFGHSQQRFYSHLHILHTQVLDSTGILI